ncbi:TlpA family protein disulfide reductase [Candidatus Woesearchaeota archaeon]|nr:TlpA family protein disulfide reductase [Candidatus Woesearchaeota archaeon]
MKAKNILLGIVAIIIIAVILLIQNPFKQKSIESEVIGSSDNEERGTSIGQLAPDIELRDFSGNLVRLSDFKGKGVIINAWAAWCPFCIDEIPDLQQASNENEDLVVIFVHRTKTENPNRANSYLEDFKAKGTPVTDPIVQDPDDSFYSTFFGFGMPVTLFVDKDGIIRDKKIGPMALEEIRERSKKIL